MTPSHLLLVAVTAAALLAAFPAATAVNITQLLGQHSDFSQLNDLLAKSRLSDEINHRQAITILALDNQAVSIVQELPADTAKKVLSLHVILDYYDEPKLKKLPNKTAILTTLFQSSGAAAGQQGFLNVTDFSSGDVAFGSAVKDADINSKLVKTVASKPYNISVIQVSTPIIPPGLSIGSIANSPGSAPAPSKKKKKKTPDPASPGVSPTGDDGSSSDDDSSSGPAPSLNDEKTPAPVPENSSAGRTATTFGTCLATVVLGTVYLKVAA